MADPKKFNPETWDEEKAAQAEAWATMTSEDFTAETGKTPEDHNALRDAVLRYHSLGSAPAEGQAPAPEPGLTEARVQPYDQPSAPPAKRDVSGWASFLTGLGRGATADFMDEGASALMGGEVNDGTGIPREYAAGSRYADNRDTLRAEQNEAAAANPGLTLAGQVVGGLPAAVALPGAGAGASAANVAGRAALQGAALGSVSGAGASTADNAAGVAEDALGSAGVGAVLGPAMSGALRSGLSPAANAARVALDAKADRNRVAGFGLYGSDMRNLLDNIGEEGVSKLARDAEAKGLHKGQALGVTGGVERGAQNAEALRQSSGRQIGATEAEILASENVPQVDVRPAISGLREASKAMDQNLDLDAPRDAKFMAKQATRIAQPKPVDAGDGTERLVERDFVPLKDAIANKRDVAGRIDWGRKAPAVTPVKETTRKFVHKELLGGIERTLQDAAERGELDPQLVKDYLQANKDFHLAATLSDPAQARVYREAGNQKVGLLDMIAGGAGWSAGGAGQAVPAIMAAKVIKNRAAPALANVQRASARGAGVLGAVAGAGAEPVGNLTAQQAAQLREWLASQKSQENER